jgi:hypothetical protein
MKTENFPMFDEFDEIDDTPEVSFASRGDLGDARATAPGPGVTSRKRELGTVPPRTGTSPNGNFTRENEGK